GEKRAYDYTRSANPTRDLLAEAIAKLELGIGAVVTATGMAAITLVGYLIPAGARIVAPHDCYGGTYRLFEAWRRRGEREVEFIDFGDLAAVKAALARPAALLWIETPSNPLLRITDVEHFAALGHAAGALVVVGAVVARTKEMHEQLIWWANCLGITGAPFDSYLTLRGLRTLHARLEH